MTSPIGLGIQPILEEFSREGCVLVPGIFDPEEVAALRAKTDRFAADETLAARHRTSLARQVATCASGTKGTAVERSANLRPLTPCSANS